jgi:tRNA threonylcarbamoyl adenosine modification protein YjeE
MIADGRSAAEMQSATTWEVPLRDEAATLALGKRLAGVLARGDLLTLRGELGAGKTTLSRGILHALGHHGPVPSPTFTLVQHYATRGLELAHFDLYRLANRDEVFELGFEDALHDGVVLVEWPDILGDGVPADRLAVQLEDAGAGRLARLTGFGSWGARLRVLRD